MIIATQLCYLLCYFSHIPTLVYCTAKNKNKTFCIEEFLLFQSCSAKPKACVADKRRLMITPKPSKRNDKHTSYLRVCLCICERTITVVPNLDLTFTWGHASTGFTGHTHTPTLLPPLCCGLHFCKIHDTSHGGYEHAALQGCSYIRGVGGGKTQKSCYFYSSKQRRLSLNRECTR